MDSRKFLAIDIGGSKLLTAVITVEEANNRRRGVFSGAAKRTLDRHSGKEGVLEAIRGAVAETFHLTGMTMDDIAGIGATIPGLADPVTGTWVYAPFSGIADFPIASQLEKEFGKKVRVENDVNACAWAEKIFGACQNVNDFLWITISNGIGGGLVLGGKIYPGTYGGAAEIGHFNIVENGALCGCGNRGCLEAEAAGPAIARRFEEMLAQNGAETRQRVELLKWKKQIAPDLPLAAAEIAELARVGDPVAKKVYDMTGYYVGRAAAFAANIINPACIVIGGGVAGAFDLFETEMKKTFYAQVFHDANKEIRILKTGLGYEAGLYAAASLLYLDE